MPKHRAVPAKISRKEQLKIQIDPGVHQMLRELCASSRRSPAGQIEFMTIAFHKGGLDRAGRAE